MYHNRGPSEELEQIVSGGTSAVVPTQGGVTVANAVTSFVIAKSAEGRARSTCVLYAKRLKDFIRFARGLGVEHMDDLNADVLRGYLAALRESGHHDPGAVSQHYRILRTRVKWFWREWDLPGRSPIDRVSAPPSVERQLPPVTEDVVRRLLLATDKPGSQRARVRDRAILLTLFDTGVRASELCNWDATDFDPATGALTIRTRKTHRMRQVFVSGQAARALRAWVRVHLDVQPLFHTDSGKRVSYSSLREVTRRLATRAKVPCPPLHGFSRGYATIALREGQDLLTLSRLLGHTSLTMLSRYAQSTVEDLGTAHALHSPGDKV
jgi:integrase